MRGTLLVIVAAGACSCSSGPRLRHTQAPLPPPPARDAAGLPPLPASSPRNASYTIEARLDPETHRITGSAVLEWRNLGAVAVSSFPFHLYWNAFRNTLSTTAREEGRRTPDPKQGDRGYGWIEVRKVQRLATAGRESDPEMAGGGSRPSPQAAGSADEDLTPTLRYLHEDGNEADRTVAEVRSASPVAPGETARFRLEWESLLPYGSVGRAGWVHDYNFVAQWFPKIGVLTKDGWNAHPFHAWAEFFSDFGVYDVRLTLPRGFVVGATGRLQQHVDNPDGSQTLRFVQEDVHDFAWVASRRLLERHDRFEQAGYSPVSIRLLLQPEHEHLAERYLEATKIALRTYGTWSAPYPYAQITVVDPAWGSASGGMEYPTLLTGGTQVLAPPELQNPEIVTIHEVGHQFWYGLVANNESEEAWLDEGLDTYMTEKALAHSLGPAAWSRRFFGADRGGRGGWPFVVRQVTLQRGASSLAALREGGEKDVMARPAWAYRDAGSWGLNTYGKPALVLLTLERLIGDETMVRVLRTYARRFRFAHPTTADFIATVNEVTGQDWRWFFDETFFSSEVCDYGVEASTQPAAVPDGWFETPSGQLELRHASTAGAVDSRVTVIRHGEVRMPVELDVEFEDGRVRERWDGQDRWHRFEYPGRRVVHAIVDPEQKLAIDVDRVNNEWVASDGPALRAASKWAERYMLWVQALLEMSTVIG